MKIEFIKQVKRADKLSCITLQKRGKLSFSNSVREELSITIDDYFKIGTDTENKNKKIFYLLKVNEKEPDSIKMNKSGKAHFLKVAFALPEINVDSENKKYTINHSIVESDKKRFIKIEFEEK